MSEKSIAEKLKELFELHTSGALTREEYDTLKSEILDGEKHEEKSKEGKTSANTPSKTKQKRKKSKEQINDEVITNQESSEPEEDLEIKSHKKAKSNSWILWVIVVFSLIAIGYYIGNDVYKSKGNLEKTTNTEQTIRNKVAKYLAREFNDDYVHKVLLMTRFNFNEEDIYAILSKSSLKNSYTNEYLILELRKGLLWSIRRSSNPVALDGYYDFKFEKIAPDDYGLHAKIDQGGMGRSSICEEVFLFTEETFNSVLSVCHSNLDGDFTPSLTIIPNDTDYYRIETNYGSDHYFQKRVYVFNGQEYVLE